MPSGVITNFKDGKYISSINGKIATSTDLSTWTYYTPPAAYKITNNGYFFYGQASASSISFAKTNSLSADIPGKGGMVWLKRRDAIGVHYLADTVRGAGYIVQSDTTTQQQYSATGYVSAFGGSGFTVTAGPNYEAYNQSATPYASWTFRKAPKFFDVVTYTGDGAATKTLGHFLGVVPGMIVTKCTSTANDWYTYHRSLGGADKYLIINGTNASATSTTLFGNTTPTATQFTVGGAAGLNINGATYVAYLFAHDASADGIIQCGSFTTDGSGNATVNLGWEPQYLMVKSSSDIGGWRLVDSLRGMSVGGSNDAILQPNTSGAEFANLSQFSPSATGFYTDATFPASTTFIYLAIRRPNKPPTTGTQVFSASSYTALNPAYQTDFVVDASFYKIKNTVGSWQIASRMQGAVTMQSDSTAAEAAQANWKWDYNNGWRLGTGSAFPEYYSWMFRRAPACSMWFATPEQAAPPQFRIRWGLRLS